MTGARARRRRRGGDGGADLAGRRTARGRRSRWRPAPATTSAGRRGPPRRPGAVRAGHRARPRPPRRAGQPGRPRRCVVPPARVGVLSTGDELVAGAGPAAARARSATATGPCCWPWCARAGCVPVDLGTAPDDEAAITAAVQRGVAGCDALLTSGGVSVGDFDYVKAVLDRLGRHALVAGGGEAGQAAGLRHGAAGRRCSGCRATRCRRMVSFELFARPALRQMMGHRDLFRPEVPAVADERPAPAARRQAPPRAGGGRARRRRPLARALRRAARGRTCCGPWPWPTPWPCSPTATAWPLAAP